ncbi:MAG: hypothetical protein ICV54_25410 [Nostoc sp. C3-bin3]|nr:hypothetical protein [Nostoc sp. C3-bin3]
MYKKIDLAMIKVLTLSTAKLSEPEKALLSLENLYRHHPFARDFQAYFSVLELRQRFYLFRSYLVRILPSFFQEIKVLIANFIERINF